MPKEHAEAAEIIPADAAPGTETPPEKPKTKAGTKKSGKAKAGGPPAGGSDKKKAAKKTPEKSKADTPKKAETKKSGKAKADTPKPVPEEAAGPVAVPTDIPDDAPKEAEGAPKDITDATLPPKASLDWLSFDSARKELIAAGCTVSTPTKPAAAVKAFLSAYDGWRGKSKLSSATRSVVKILRDEGAGALATPDPVAKTPRIARDTYLMVLDELSKIITLDFVTRTDDMDDETFERETKKKIDEASADELRDGVIRAAGVLQIEDELSCLTKGILTKLSVGPWYDPVGDSIRESLREKRSRIQKERLRSNRIKMGVVPKPIRVVYTRSHSLVDAMKEMLVDGAGVKGTELMRRANEIYVEHGGSDNQTATNVVNYTLKGLSAVGICYMDNHRLWYLQPGYVWPEAPLTENPVTAESDA